MASIKARDLLAGAVLILFLALCFHFQQKGQAGPWHSTATSLWQKEEWGKIQALGENLFRVKKEDVESYYLAMLASEHAQNSTKSRIFAERLSDTRALNWNMESEMAKVYQPETLRKRVALFRTKIVYCILMVLMLLLIVSYVRKVTLRTAPVLLSLLGIVVLFL